MGREDRMRVHHTRRVRVLRLRLWVPRRLPADRRTGPVIGSHTAQQLGVQVPVQPSGSEEKSATVPEAHDDHHLHHDDDDNGQAVPSSAATSAPVQAARSEAEPDSRRLERCDGAGGRRSVAVCWWFARFRDRGFAKERYGLQTSATVSAGTDYAVAGQNLLEKSA